MSEFKKKKSQLSAVEPGAMKWMEPKNARPSLATLDRVRARLKAGLTSFCCSECALAEKWVMKHFGRLSVKDLNGLLTDRKRLW